MKEKVLFVNKKLSDSDINKDTILIAQLEKNLVIGPKISKEFCMCCYNQKIAKQASPKITIKFSLKKVLKLYNSLRKNQLAIINKNDVVIKKYLFPSVYNHDCNIINFHVLNKCTSTNSYGLIKSYKVWNEHNFYIIRGVLDIKGVHEDYITISGKSKNKREAILRFFGEAIERYVPQLYLSRKKYVIQNFRIKTSYDSQRLDWAKKNMTTVGLSCHVSILRSLKKGFYENIEHYSIKKFISGIFLIYPLTERFENENGIDKRQFFIRNDLAIPVVITFVRQKVLDQTYYGIGISSQERISKAKKDSLYEALQILYEKEYLKLNNKELTRIYEKIFNMKYKIIKVRNSFFFLDVYKILKDGFTYSITSYKTGLKNNYIFFTQLEKKSERKKINIESKSNKERRLLLQDCGF